MFQQIKSQIAHVRFYRLNIGRRERSFRTARLFVTKLRPSLFAETIDTALSQLSSGKHLSGIVQERRFRNVLQCWTISDPSQCLHPQLTSLFLSLGRESQCVEANPILRDPNSGFFFITSGIAIKFDWSSERLSPHCFFFLSLPKKLKSRLGQTLSGCPRGPPWPSSTAQTRLAASVWQSFSHFLLLRAANSIWTPSRFILLWFHSGGDRKKEMDGAVFLRPD